MKQKAILAQRAQSYEQLQKQLHRLPLLAQGNVFAIDTPPEHRERPLIIRGPER